MVAGFTAAVALAALAIAWRMQAVAAPASPFGTLPMTFSVPIGPPDGYLAISVERRAFALSPDGRAIAMAGGVGQAQPSVSIRQLSSETLVSLAGTEGATSVFWSPDSKWIGFFSQGKLKRVDAAGGTPVTICDVRQNIGQAGTWGDGQIVFASVQGEEILTVPASGGTPRVLMKPRVSQGEDRVAWPSFLPDGHRFLYFSSRGSGKGTVMVGSIDTADTREVLPVRSNAQYVAPNQLMYGMEGTLLAQPFDPDRATVSGEPIAIADQVTHFSATGLTEFSASQTGAVLFHQGRVTTRIVRVDRVGREIAQLRPAGGYMGMRLYDHGRELYVDRADPKTSRMDIWKIELNTDRETRLTSEPAAALEASIAADGSMIFSTARVVLRWWCGAVPTGRTSSSSWNRACRRQRTSRRTAAGSCFRSAWPAATSTWWQCNSPTRKW